MTLNLFARGGNADVLIGGQWGSEGKGAAAAWLVERLARSGQFYDIFTTNAGAQAGHTSILPDGEKIVLFHLPTGAIVTQRLFGRDPIVYLNAGSVIDPNVLRNELEGPGRYLRRLYIHPMAAVITPENCAESQRLDDNSKKISGVGKGVGKAIAARVARTGMVARDHPYLRHFVCEINLNSYLDEKNRVLVEVPQGIGLSLAHSGFYPYTTSRDCTVGNALADAAIHPSFLGQTLLVLRTYPIRVGNVKNAEGTEIGWSGPCYPDQKETSWENLGVTPEITTVSKRVRRVFTFSRRQLRLAVRLTRPSSVLLTFCNYASREYLKETLHYIVDSCNGHSTSIYTQWGPASADVGEHFAIGGVARTVEQVLEPPRKE